jgi:hypothetical protein
MPARADRPSPPARGPVPTLAVAADEELGTLRLLMDLGLLPCPPLSEARRKPRPPVAQR